MLLADISPKFNEETLDKIVKLAGGSKCTSWEFAGGFKKGDSYLSEVYRLHLEDESNVKVDLVIKSIPKNVARRKTFRSSDFFRNEYNFYKDVLSEFYKFQSERKPKNPFTEISECFETYCDGVDDFIAMDDLGMYGYRTASRQEGIGIPECLFCMKSLGRLHALSFAMKDQQPETFNEMVKSLEENYYAAKHKDWYKNFIKIQIAIAKDAVGQEYGGTEIEDKMLQFFDCDLYDKMVSLTHTTNKNSVINHGDCWMPNFLFKFSDDGKPVATKMIDFQLSRYSSPVLDISFFIYSCTDHELREKHYDELLKMYHESLSEMLRDLGSDPDKVFPFSELEKELKEFARFGCGMGIESIPFSLLDDSEAPDLDTITGEEAVRIENVWILKPIKTKEGRLRLANMFKHAVQYGYLD